MVELDVDVTFGGIHPLKVASTSTDVRVIGGPARLMGWSFRDVSSLTPVEAQGSVVAPGAGVTICTTGVIAAGNYTVNWTVELAGPAAAADANNFEISDTAGNVLASVNAGAAGVYPQPPIQIDLPQGDAVLIKSIGAGTAGVTYTASVTLTPTSLVETVVEIQDGQGILGESSMAAGKTDSFSIGWPGSRLSSEILIHVVSGAVTGTVYAVFEDTD